MSTGEPVQLDFRRRYEALRSLGLKLDLTRGKPSEEQLALSEPLLHDTATHARDGSDCRNYGHLEGLPEARELFGSYLAVPAENTFVLGNSSLAIMHDLVVEALVRPLPDASASWNEIRMLGMRPKMLCPVPGYDRHHQICETYDIEMIPVPLLDSGPDMHVVVELLKDPSVVGMWCIPKYANPSGATYSYKVCRQLAWLKTTPAFRIFWDLAYTVHDLTDVPDELPNMLELCREAHHEDRVFIVGSTSKITFASGGVAVLAASTANLAWYKRGLSAQTIGPDKLNQLRHVRFLRDMDGVRAHMARHREIIRPKFDAVDEVLTRELGNSGLARWNTPRGGYFVSLQVMNGCAKKVVALASELGVKLTPAGAAFPYGEDPGDSHIRIAPTYPSLNDVRKAMEVVALCVRLAVET